MGSRIEVFVCGTQKGGTTSLHEHLRRHPQLSPPAVKELHVFDDEGIDWTAPDYGAIDRFFAAEDGGRLRFDVTPVTMFWEPALPRIRAYNPDAKLIFLFRDPFERARSHWIMEHSRGAETLPFRDAIRQERERLANLPPLARERRIHSYVARGLYGGQVRRALSLFPRGQLLFLLSEAFFADHGATLDRIARFLGIGPFPDGGAVHLHGREDYASRPETDGEDLALVSSLLREDLLAFRALTGLPVEDWPVMRAIRGM